MCAMSLSLLRASRQVKNPPRGCPQRSAVVDSKERMTDPRKTRGAARRVRGLACLLALLLYTPGVRAAWLVMSGACCGAGRCPIAAHHHQVPESPGASPDCGHAMEGSSPKAAACSMSCCRTDQQPALHVPVFLPAPILSSAAPAPSVPAAASARPAADSLSPDPPIPPPEFPAAV